MECENLKGLQYLSSSGLPKTFLKIILATYLTSETSTALACTGLVVKSIAGIFRYQKKSNFPKKLQMLQTSFQLQGLGFKIQFITKKHWVLENFI